MYVVPNPNELTFSPAFRSADLISRSVVGALKSDEAALRAYEEKGVLFDDTVRLYMESGRVLWHRRKTPVYFVHLDFEALGLPAYRTVRKGVKFDWQKRQTMHYSYEQIVRRARQLGLGLLTPAAALEHRLQWGRLSPFGWQYHYMTPLLSLGSRHETSSSRRSILITQQNIDNFGFYPVSVAGGFKYGMHDLAHLFVFMAWSRVQLAPVLAELRAQYEVRRRRHELALKADEADREERLRVEVLAQREHEVTMALVERKLFKPRIH